MLTREAHPPLAGKTLVPMTSPHGSLLLIAADSTTSRMLCDTLQPAGYRLTLWVPGSPALALIAEQNFDAILLDTALTEPDACMLLTGVRSKYSAADLPVLLLTNEQDHSALRQGLRLGANDYLPKSLLSLLAPGRVHLHVAHKRTAAALQASEKRYTLTALGARDGLWTWDLVTNHLYISPRWEATLGYTEAPPNKTLDFWLTHIHPAERALFETVMARHLAGHTPYFEHEYRMLHQDGTYRWVLSRGLADRDATGKPVYIAGSHTDITDRKEADVLTTLPNRTVFLDRLRCALDRMDHHPDTLCVVLLLDLDRFKMVNESLGPTCGDQLLLAFIQRLEACLDAASAVYHFTSGYTIARLGGDEFGVLIEGMQDSNEVIPLTNQIQQSLALPFVLHGHEIVMTVSIGIAITTTTTNRPEDILRDADMAMYRAKTRGRGYHEVFDTAMRARALSWLQVETDMRRALERQEFCVYYQPIVELASGTIVGFEALTRWYHPHRGLVPPSEFIPIAEDNGLIIPIGWQCLRIACQQMARWQAQFPTHRPLAMSVNLSARQFRQQDLVQHILQILRETQLDPPSLKLEITETAVMDNPILTTSMLEQLRDLGIQLSMDDFGTGYSSLSYLHRFPVQILKIDRSFVNRLDMPGEKTAIVRTILSLAAALDLEVVAEGIETLAQWVALHQLSCRYGQGYFFSKPLEREAATALLTSSPHWLAYCPLTEDSPMALAEEI